MAAAVADETGRTVVITGGFHTVALPNAEPATPPPGRVPDDDAMLVLVRYGFEQLDALNGYGSGMPSPEFYQRCWEGTDLAGLVVELARLLRRRQADASTADAVAAFDHARRLALLRGHPTLSREDFLDGVRSTFIKGADDVEGALVLAHARKLLAGTRIGRLPADAGRPPLVTDFQRTATRLRLDTGSVDAKEVTLDLYRKRLDRERSRFFHRLRFLGVAFARLVRGPDFVAGEDLERIQEVWRYHWEPSHEAAVVERSLYGSTLDEAAAALLFERFAVADDEGRGRSASLAARLLLEACRMGLHRHSQQLLDRTARLAAEDAAFESVVAALESVLALTVSREPLEAHDLRGVSELAATLYHRACYLLPELAAAPDESLEDTLDALNALQQAVQTLGDDPDRQAMRQEKLRLLADAADGSPAIHGAALGLLFGDGRAGPDELAARLAGHFLGNRRDGAAGAGFLRGLLRTARSALWQIPQLIEQIHRVLGDWDEPTFIEQLPLMRLALADLTPRECDRVARTVAARAGVERLSVGRDRRFSEADLLRAVDLNRRVADTLARDGLDGFLPR
jgi:hypothetical protein